MRIFVSSLVTGMEPLREAARSAIRELGHEAVMAEDFGARPHSPQVACLDGLRQSAAVVLILGARYGVPQHPSCISATHEEYREARERRPVLAFVQEGVDREAAEAEFVEEVQSWSGGPFRGGFRTPEELRSKITRAIHEWELANAAGPVYAEGLVSTALALMPVQEVRQTSGRPPGLAFAVASGPSQGILRPSEIEDQGFRQELLKAALFGPTRIFDPSRGNQNRMQGHALQLRQDDSAELLLDPQGTIRICVPLPERQRQSASLPAIIQEDVSELLKGALGYAAWLLERIDPTARLTQSALAVTLTDTSAMPWRTRREHEASPQSMTLRVFGSDPGAVTLSPPVRPRAALRIDSDRLVEDLVTLLRREWRSE